MQNSRMAQCLDHPRQNNAVRVDTECAPAPAHAPPEFRQYRRAAPAPPPAPVWGLHPSSASRGARCSRAASRQRPVHGNACPAQETPAAGWDGYSAYALAKPRPGAASAAACSRPGRQALFPPDAARHRWPLRAPLGRQRTDDDQWRLHERPRLWPATSQARSDGWTPLSRFRRGSPGRASLRSAQPCWSRGR